MGTKVIGLAGRAGSGKSAAARSLASRGDMEWIDLDPLAWETYRPGTDTFDRLVGRFGRTIVGAEGTIDRRCLAESALAGPAARDDLEAIVHPAIMQRLQERIGACRTRGVGVLLVEGALLVHSPHVDRSLFDAIVWLDASDRSRRERLDAAGRTNHAARVPDPAPEALVGIHRVSAEGAVSEVAARLLRLIETVKCGRELAR